MLGLKLEETINPDFVESVTEYMLDPLVQVCHLICFPRQLQDECNLAFPLSHLIPISESRRGADYLGNRLRGGADQISPQRGPASASGSATLASVAAVLRSPRRSGVATI